VPDEEPTQNDGPDEHLEPVKAQSIGVVDAAVSVTGPIRQTASGFFLEVRQFTIDRKT
jgi:hypothetical protein